MRRTKIVCTIGPASDSETRLTSMMKGGMDVARLNFSHGTHVGHRKLYRAIRRAATAAGKHVPIIGDLQGPKIRLGNLPEEGVKLKTGETILFSTKSDRFVDGVLPVTYKQLHKDVKAGQRLLIDDGLVEAKVTKVQGQTIRAVVINGGMVTSHKGMNFPDSNLQVSAITKKDKEDAIFGVGLGVDWIALSFVTNAKDVRALKRLLKKHTPEGKQPPRVIVKIEKHEAIDRFTEILKAADGIMVARGDLGIEINAEEVPVRQKEILDQARLAGKPVVVATQMLDSMIRNPRPTRAEVSDVANAVFDHTDAVMLSGESATGKYPLKAVKMMRKIIEEAEASPYDDVPLSGEEPLGRLGALARAIKLMVLQGNLHAVIISYEMAPWAEAVQKIHPEIPFFVATKNREDAQRIALRWGITPFVMSSQRETTFAKRAVKMLKEKRLLRKGMSVGLILGGEHGEGIDLITVE